MKRKVKCQDTGEYSTSDIAYKAPDNKYYSSEESYKKIITDKQFRKDCIELMLDIFDTKIISSIFYKKLDELNVYGYDVLLKTIDLNRPSIEWALDNRDFNNEYNKISYVMAIIKNNLNETNELIKKQKKIIIEEKRVQDMNIDTQITNKINPKIKIKDVSSLLGD